jgi:hypothetical protein
MLRTLAQVFGRLVSGRRVPAPRRRVSSFRPQIEALGERIVPAGGLGVTSIPAVTNPFAHYFFNWPPGAMIVDPANPPNLVNKSVDITNPSDPQHPDIGTVVIQSQDAAGNFQGTFECHLQGDQVRLISGEKFTAGSLDIGAIPITGKVDPPTYSLLGGYSYHLSFQGAATGMVQEQHDYALDTDGTPEHETWMVSDTETISFNGSVSESPSGLTLNGNVNFTSVGQWLASADHLAPTDPHHRTVPLSSIGETLDLGIMASISDPIT